MFHEMVVAASEKRLQGLNDERRRDSRERNLNFQLKRNRLELWGKLSSSWLRCDLLITAAEFKQLVIKTYGMAKESPRE